jgi:hypothetical protein
MGQQPRKIAARRCASLFGLAFDVAATNAALNFSMLLCSRLCAFVLSLDNVSGLLVMVAFLRLLFVEPSGFPVILRSQGGFEFILPIRLLEPESVARFSSFDLFILPAVERFLNSASRFRITQACASARGTASCGLWPRTRASTNTMYLPRS